MRSDSQRYRISIWGDENVLKLIVVRKRTAARWPKKMFLNHILLSTTIWHPSSDKSAFVAAVGSRQKTKTPVRSKNESHFEKTLSKRLISLSPHPE